MKTKIIQAKGNSPLTHVSVGKWMKESGYAIGSAEGKDRCAPVTASVAHHHVQDLNAWKDGTYKQKSTWEAVSNLGITAPQNCTECPMARMCHTAHGKEIDLSQEIGRFSVVFEGKTLNFIGGGKRILTSDLRVPCEPRGVSKHIRKANLVNLKKGERNGT